MKTVLLSAMGLVIGAGSLVSARAPERISGDYVEARTASVFTGACHYNGELVTTGRQAVAAWNFTSGSFNGVDLAGVRALAAVSSDANLGEQNAARKAELIIDTQASEAQAKAVAALLREKNSASLGEIVSVRRAAVSFTRTGGEYAVKADGIASMSVKALPDGECCKQPNLVWYAPLAPIADKKVGYTQNAAYLAGTVGDTWQRSGENSAFYGSFGF